MEKELTIEAGKRCNFKASAFSPIQYNRLFKGRDFLRDIQAMAEKSQEMQDGDRAAFTAENYEQFARMAYLFAYQGLSPTPSQTQQQKDFLAQYPDPWSWIDSFNTFSIYQLLPEIVALWYGSDIRLVKEKKAPPAPPET